MKNTRRSFFQSLATAATAAVAASKAPEPFIPAGSTIKVNMASFVVPEFPARPIPKRGGQKHG